MHTGITNIKGGIPRNANNKMDKCLFKVTIKKLIEQISLFKGKLPIINSFPIKLYKKHCSYNLEVTICNSG